MSNLMKSCRAGHSVRFRFRTAQGHLRCAQCLAAARQRYIDKHAHRSIGRALRNVVEALQPLDFDEKKRVLRALAVLGVTA